jgi:hypothetical protein
VACTTRMINFRIMKRILAISSLFAIVLAPGLQAQLTPDQKTTDFMSLVALVSKNYAFVEWKRTAIQFDALKLAPWLTQIQNSPDDASFWKICSQYIASLQDSHSVFAIPSDWTAQLGFTVDLYDGKLLIDSIDPTFFSPRQPQPVQIGDELVAIDGKMAMDLINDIASQVGDGNSRSGKRYAASLLVNREQDIVAQATQISDQALLLIQRSGVTSSVSLPWVVAGTPYSHAGPVPSPSGAISHADVLHADVLHADSPSPNYMEHARKRQQFRIAPRRFVSGFGALAPIFNLPSGFTQRLGKGRYDSYFTGTFNAGGFTIGYLRVPDFLFLSSTDFQDRTLLNEISYFQANTDGLVVDVMRNPGGYGCTSEGLAQLLQPNGYLSLGVSIRATWLDVMSAQQDLDYATANGATDSEIAELTQILQALKDAFNQNRGMTQPLPLCGPTRNIPSYLDRTGKTIAYSKPIMILTDEFTASAAELFAAIMQDTGRATLYGMRTDGAGGAVGDFNAGVYSESSVSLASAIAVRSAPVVTMDYPAAPYIENIGVRPDTILDDMTADNLTNHGKTFVDGFTTAMVNYIQSRSNQTLASATSARVP